MESRSFVLERQERFSYETNERIYLNEHRLYQNPSIDVAGISSSSDDIEKIHRTRERVESLNSQINFEIERLKDVKNSLQKKDDSLMTWAQRFRANPPLINVLNKQQCPGRLDVLKPGPRKEVKQRDVSPRRQPPNMFPPNEIPPKEYLPKEIPKEIRPNGHPKELTAKVTPPIRLPPKELPHKELTYILLPKQGIPPKELPHNKLNPSKPQPRVLPAKEIPPKGLALKEINPREPTTGGLPPKAIPLKGVPSKGVLAKTISSKGVPPKINPSKGVPPKGVPPKGVPPKEVPRKVPPKGVPLKTIPPKGVPSKPIPPKGIPPKALPPKGVPPKTIPPKGIPPKTIPPKGLPPKTVPPKGAPPKTTLSKGVPPKEITLRKPPPKVIPPKDLPAKRLPLKELPAKKTPPKAPMMTRKAPPKISTQKDLKPEKPPAKDVAPKEPIPKQEPKQGSLGGDATPEELVGRISAGCCHCYWNCDQCVCPTLGGVCCIAPTDYNCNMGFNQGIQYGVPYCTARRRVTDLNTQEICSNRCVGISPDRKSSKSTSVRDSTKDKRKSPVRSRRSSPANKMRNQEKLPKVESQKKVQKVPVLEKRPQGPEKIVKEKPRLKKDYQPPGKTNQEKPKAPKTNVTKLDLGAPIASPTKDENILVDARMYEDYLNSYFEENSKTDLLESPKPTPTYTRLQEETVPKESPISDRKIGERKEHQTSGCFAEMYPGPFRYEECFEDQDYTSPDNNKTEPVSDPQPTSPKDWQGPQPIESSAYSQQHKSTKCEDKICQGERSSLARDWETDSTSYAALPVKRQSETPSTRQASTTTETQRSKERSSLTYALHSSEKSTQVYNDRLSNLSSGPRSSRKAQSPTTDSPRLSNLSNGASLSRKSRSPTTDSPRLSNLSNGASLYRRAQSPTTDSPRLSNLSNGATSSRKAQSPTADSPRLSNLSNGVTSSRKAQSPTTDSPRLSPISFREGSSQVPQSPTRDSNRQGNASPISFGANSSRIAASETADSTFNTIVSNPHYQAEEFCSDDSSDEGTEYDPRIDMQLLDTDVVSNKNTSFEDAFSTLSGKAVRSSNESPRGSFKKPSSRRQSQEEANGYKNKYYSSQTDDIQSRCECNGYDTARSIDSSKHSNFLRGRSSSPDKSGGDESLPLVETLCEKRTRTVTFKDEQGDLKRQRNVEKECRSHYNWDQALNYSRQDSTFSNDNYTPRSSSSAEHTCLESSFDEDDAYDSCFESPRRSDEQMPTFKACPCMYETYRQLAALCQSKSPYYR